MAARKPVGDDELVRFGVTHGGHEIGLRHGARHVLRLGLIAEGAGHSATGRNDRRDGQIGRLAQGRESRIEGAEAFLMAMAVDMRLRRRRSKLERNLLARHPLAERDGAARERSRFASRQQGHEFVAQGHEAGGFEPDDKRIAGERRQGPTGFGARLLDQAGREIGPAATKRAAVMARRERPPSSRRDDAERSAQIVGLEIAVERVGEQQHVARSRSPT